MKLPLSSLLAIAMFLITCQPEEPSSQPVRKALFAIVDGIPADVVERVNTPWIDSVASEGGYTRAYTGGHVGGYSETPTISAVCYASLITGVWGNKHNVWNNNIEAPNYHYPTVFWYFKNHFPEKKIGLFSTWEDNRTKLLGEGKAETGNIKVDFHADGYELDTVNYPHDPASHYIHQIDERVSREAAQAIRDEAPDLSWVYLQYTDDVGHRSGDSPEMDSAVVAADTQLGRLWEAVKYREANFNEEWLVYIVTDHGRDDQGYHHGGQSPRERSIWISTNDKNLNAHFREHQPALVDVMPTVIRFMDVEVPQAYRFEWDGVPLSGDISHIFQEATLQGDSLLLGWEALKVDGNLNVWLATTNEHAAGGRDTYVSLLELPISAGQVTVDISEYPSDFYKVVLASADQATNRWVLRE